MEAKDKYKLEFANAVAMAFRAVYPSVFANGGADTLTPDAIYDGLEKPRDPKMGRFAFPVFKLVKLVNDKPMDIAAKVADEANRILAHGPASSIVCRGVSGFLNAEINATNLTAETVIRILLEKNAYGALTVGKGKIDLVEYSSPNIAKPFGVGHLRTTVIGNSLRRIFKKLGYTVIGINYPGDWGTQFGKMIVAYTKWGTPETLQGNPVKNLLALYVRFHVEAEKDPTLDDQARGAFKSLEDGDPDALKLWEVFKQISHEEFDRVYTMLGVEFDLVYGESFLNDKMEAVIERLQKAGLTSVSRGALVVDLGDPNLPPALLKRTDGATLYLTRDLAGMIWRWEKYHFNESLYVVGSSQADHFRQCLKVIALLEEAENRPPEDRMTGRVKHVDFGWVKFGDKTMSTRRGNIILLDNLLDEAIALVKARIEEKNPGLANIDEVARVVGVGAVIYSQLSVRRQKDVNFVWDDVLNFEGETGPYLQYTHARLCALIRNYGKPVINDVDYSLLDAEEERRVVELLADFPTAISDSAAQYDPYSLVSYLIRLSGAFNKFYQRKDQAGRIDKIISDNVELSAARIALVEAVRIVINEGLYLLGLQAPEEM